MKIAHPGSSRRDFLDRRGLRLLERFAPVPRLPTAGTASTTSVRSGSAASLAPVHGTYNPSIDPANFVAAVDNRYLPFKPGTGLHYKGVAEDGKTPQTDDEVVTHQTKRILGVNATVVRDVVSERGKPIEKTFDWYAQDKQGNVWYMGEDAREFHHGKFVKAPDSWQAGVDGAQPGIIMPGDPQPGDAYRQEYYPGHALDQARVVGAKGTVNVPAGAYKRPLVTVETSALEAGRGRAEVQRPGRRRGQGAGGEGEPRALRARAHHATEPSPSVAARHGGGNDRLRRADRSAGGAPASWAGRRCSRGTGVRSPATRAAPGCRPPSPRRRRRPGRGGRGRRRR